ncbi:MAG: CBS domain-containing protein [Acidobacteriota bacterium]|nr:CBS domain-containing protein [Acidobacteriota bacterium]
MICPSCGHENLPGAEVCEQCMHDLMGLDLPQPKEGLQRRLMEDPVRVLPLRPPVTISPEEPVGRALELMRQHRIGSVLVVEGGSSLASSLNAEHSWSWLALRRAC